MYHVPAHKSLTSNAGQVAGSFHDTAKAFKAARQARFEAEADAFIAKWTPQEDEAFDAIPSTTYERADTSWVDFQAASPYNHRSCDAIVDIGSANIESNWPLFSIAAAYCLDAPTWIPSGYTRRSMFADDKDAPCIVHTPISERED